VKARLRGPGETRPAFLSFLERFQKDPLHKHDVPHQLFHLAAADMDLARRGANELRQRTEFRRRPVQGPVRLQ